MANELRVRANFLGGLIEDNPLTLAATTLTSAALAAAPVIGSTQHMPIVLDPDGRYGEPEIAYITAHTASATTATILRGQEGTTARAHQRDINWSHGPTSLDVPEYPTRSARGYRTTAQALPSGSWTTITYDVEAYDLYGMLTPSTGVFTPGRTGLYLCAAVCTFGASTTGRRGIAVTKNGTQVAMIVDTPTGGGFDTYRQISQVIAVTAVTDTLTFQAFQDNGVSINTGAAESAVSGTIVRVGDV